MHLQLAPEVERKLQFNSSPVLHLRLHFPSLDVVPSPFGGFGGLGIGLGLGLDSLQLGPLQHLLLGSVG